MFDNKNFDDHEKVVHINDRESGLRAIIAIHSTALGPAAGGCRLWSYPSADAALDDALRLSRGMSYKNAVAGVPLGGGKGVILGPVAAEKRSAAFRAFGDAVNALGGAYITAEDVGVSVEDMRAVASRTRFVSGLSAASGRAGGDPSPYTARGVRRGIEAVARHALGRSDLEGLRVAVQGLGNVGGNLCRELAARGARLWVADIDPARVARICDLYGATPAGVDEILYADVDLVAPCALGGAITEEVARALRARAVAGAANNQLATPLAGDALFARGIAYAPDYVINAGGIIVAAAEYFGDNSVPQVEAAVDRIYDRVLDILKTSAAFERPCHVIADQMAQDIISRASGRSKARRSRVPLTA